MPNKCMRFPDDGLVDGFLREKLSSIWKGFDKVGTKSIVMHVNSTEHTSLVLKG